MGSLLKMIEDAFSAAAFSEERPFGSSAKETMRQFEKDEVSVAMAEGGVIPEEDRHPAEKGRTCELEDLDCFLHKNE
jgi:hypothetical protein